MYEQVEKPKENKSRAVANSVAQKKSIGRQSFGFVDNRTKEKADDQTLQKMRLNYQPDESFQIASPRNTVVQCGRDKLPDTRQDNGLDRMPSVNFGAYAAHVSSRTKMFFIVILKARLAVLAASHTPTTALFTNHAAAQTGVGMRGQPGFQTMGGTPVHGSNNVDAAHRMNTTLNPTAAATQGMSPTLVNELYTLSAGTSQQFQASNVTSDKIIDSCQSATKDSILLSPATTDIAFLKSHLTTYLTKCQADLLIKVTQHAASWAPGVVNNAFIKAHSYKTAYDVISDQLNNIDSLVTEIWSELSP